VVCRECGGELPPAFAGRPRSYCSVTCRQRAYRRRKSEAAAEKTTKEDPGAPQGPETGRSRSASAEAIMIRVRLDEPGADPQLPSAPPTDWHTLNELALAALLLARRLRAGQQGDPDAPADTAQPAQDHGPGPVPEPRDGSGTDPAP